VVSSTGATLNITMTSPKNRNPNRKFSSKTGSIQESLGKEKFQYLLHVEWSILAKLSNGDCALERSVDLHPDAPYPYVIKEVLFPLALQKFARFSK
jgi:hypothetical protein